MKKCPMYANGTNTPNDPNSPEMMAAAREFTAYFMKESNLFNQIMNDAADKFNNRKAAKLALKSEVYFMTEDFEGKGIVYRIDGETVKVFSPVTQKMYTVELSLIEKV